MLLEFLAVIVAGFGGGGTAMIVNRFSGRRLPEAFTPFSVAAGMLAMVVYLEYSWADRFEAGLPDEVVIVSKNQQQSWFRPWTYVVPLTNRMIAVDNRIRQRNRDNPDLVLTGVILQERWALTMGFKSMFDCANARRADLTEGTRLDEGGIPVSAEWYSLAPDDRFLTIACGGGAHGGVVGES
ncbi:hypothetical protein LY56_01174 [Roseinatronobacter thiooxidans]|uniref:Uncharacterized protein n=1 Tax=Roseinatronobacter thiooxidans TaxID=121821 RepID=A0A2W7S6M3_9RHOB|nr:hypothetical protein [Roseinatronobacter thiooxidans]PZX46202.1 hypothetical protein LY56_01174 [Roseinatronobacter thiooxidans]